MKATIHRGKIKWRGQKPDALDRIALLGYWPQLRRVGKKSLDPKEARRFLASLGFEPLTAPRIIEELGLVVEGDLGGVSHPCGDEYGATLADDILEGRVTVTAMQRRADQVAATAKHETDVFNHGHVKRGRGHSTVTHQNRRRTS